MSLVVRIRCLLALLVFCTAFSAPLSRPTNSRPPSSLGSGAGAAGSTRPRSRRTGSTTTRASGIATTWPAAPATLSWSMPRPARAGRPSTTSDSPPHCRRRPRRSTRPIGCRSTPSSSSTRAKPFVSGSAARPGVATWRHTTCSRARARPIRRPIEDDSGTGAVAGASTPRTDGTMLQLVQQRQPERAVSAFRRREMDRLRQGSTMSVVRDARRQGNAADAGRHEAVSLTGCSSWSPDSRALVAFRIDPGDAQGGLPDRVVAARAAAGPSCIRGPTRCRATSFTAYELHLFDPAGGKADQGRSRSDRLRLPAPPLGARRPHLHATRKSTAAISVSA